MIPLAGRPDCSATEARKYRGRLELPVGERRSLPISPYKLALDLSKAYPVNFSWEDAPDEVSFLFVGDIE